MNKIQNFTDLIAWQKGHELVLRIYKITIQFPRIEAYALADQMRRAVVSITSNVAEGFSRKSNKEKTQFYYIALGSLTEIQNQLLIAKDLDYITKLEFESVIEQTILVKKLLSGLIRSLNS